MSLAFFAEPIVRPKPKPSFVPSSYQQAIFDFVENGTGNALVSAVAGAGKTTTIVECAKLARGRALFVAFNKHIAETLKGKLGNVPAATLHSTGLRALRSSIPKLDVHPWKYGEIVTELLPKHGLDNEDWARVLKLAEFARITLSLPTAEGLTKVAEDYGLSYNHLLAPVVIDVLNEGERLAAREGKIDFTDMLWLVERWELQPVSYDFLFIDELQDLNAAQRALALKLSHGRTVGVGDPRQSIMAWAGADARSWQAFTEATNATQLPLSICYRCPASHLELAREIVPEIETRPGAPEGVLEEASEAWAFNAARARDLVLCRRTAPLLKGCLSLIARGVAAKVRGRDLGVRLAEAARRIGQGCGWSHFKDGVMEWLSTRLSELNTVGAGKKRLDEAYDLAEGLLACFDGLGRECSSVEMLARKIEGLFADSGAAIWFSSIHRAKGLEAARVFVLEFSKLGEGFGFQSKAEKEQEQHLKYVALTRSTHTLVLCD